MAVPTVQRLTTNPSASLPAAVPPTTSDSALHSCPCDSSVKTAAEMSQKAAGDQTADIAGSTGPGDASENMNSPTTHKQTQNKDEYQYSPLPGPGYIRLLRLMPHEDENARIQCQLFNYRLRDSRDPNEKGQQVQSMANIYAKASRVIVWLGETAAGSDQAIEDIRTAAIEPSSKSSINVMSQQAILTLLQRQWFQRIWVLQEVAAARYVLIKCGPAEIDGYAFCLGLSALELSYKTCPELQPLIYTATYLIRDALFRPRRSTQSGRFSLHIRPLSELVDMYHTRKATEHHDKVYALLGMSSDDPSGAKLSVNYKISWGQLFQQLIHFILSKRVSVDTWDDEEIAIIKGKGCILGEVTSVEKDTAWEDRQHVGINYFGAKETWNPRWTLQTSAKSIQKYPKTELDDCLDEATRLQNVRAVWQEVEIYGMAAKNVQNAVGVFERALRSINDLELADRGYSCLGGVKKLEAMVDLVVKDEGQWALLCLAAAEGHGAVVKLLLDTDKVDLNAECLRTAVWLAAWNGHEALVKLLLDSGQVDPYAKKRGGGRWGKAVVELENGKVDPNARYQYGQAALYSAAKNGCYAAVKLLLDGGKVGPTAEYLDELTALQLAAKNGHETVVKLILDNNKVDPNAGSHYGKSALQLAAKNGHESVVKLMLDNNKVNPNYVPPSGKTALQVAA
ncbi:hypothetical protein DL765_004908 [Monosporascus sp. GIB2]|nr:hypothetical protein DL765_004908 [Monosporascus sp. GIB2]